MWRIPTFRSTRECSLSSLFYYSMVNVNKKQSFPFPARILAKQHKSFLLIEINFKRSDLSTLPKNLLQTIKMKLISIAILASTASAFAPSISHGGRSTALYERADSSAAIEAALEASKTYGATSPEAALAWEIVEELDASDNR